MIIETSNSKGNSPFLSYGNQKKAFTNLQNQNSNKISSSSNFTIDANLLDHSMRNKYKEEGSKNQKEKQSKTKVSRECKYQLIIKEITDSNEIATRILKELADQMDFNLGIIIDSSLMNKLQLLEKAVCLMNAKTFSLQCEDFPVNLRLSNEFSKDKKESEVTFSGLPTSTSKKSTFLRIYTPLNSSINLGKSVRSNEFTFNFNKMLHNLKDNPEFELPIKNDNLNDAPFFINDSEIAQESIPSELTVNNEVISFTKQNSNNIKDISESLLSSIIADEGNKSIKDFGQVIMFKKSQKVFLKQKSIGLPLIEEDLQNPKILSVIRQSYNLLEAESLNEEFHKIKECIEGKDQKESDIDVDGKRGNFLFIGKEENSRFSDANEEKDKGFDVELYSNFHTHTHCRSNN